MSVVSLDAVGEASWQRRVHPGGGLGLRGSIELVEGGVIAETSWGSTLLMSVVSLDAGGEASWCSWCPWVPLVMRMVWVWHQLATSLVSSMLFSDF